MGEKKDRGRFSIKFNEHDPAHQTVIELLERQGPRQKAQFIANAILHYIHCPETSDIHLPQTVDRAAVEAIVLEILKRQRIGESKEIQQIFETETVTRTHNRNDSDMVAETEENMDAETLKLITSTMAGFRYGA